jgi:hypothetical protein
MTKRLVNKYPEGTVCSVEGCGRAVVARMWCNMHYSRWLKRGCVDDRNKPPFAENLSVQELAWAAGLFEGEGSVRISKPMLRNWGSLVASVTNTNEQIVDFFQNRWPGRKRPATGLRPDQKPAWVWVLAARRAAVFLEAIRPFVVSDKVRQKIDHGLDFQRQKKLGHRGDQQYAEDQWNYYWWMAELNTRGCPKAAEFRRGKEA